MPQQRHKFLYWMNRLSLTHKNTISTRARVIRPWVKNLYHTKDPWQDFRVGKMHLYLRPLQLARDALRKRAKKVEKSCISCVYLSSIPSAIFHYQWSFHTVIHLKSLVNTSSMQDACHIWVLVLGVFFSPLWVSFILCDWAVSGYLMSCVRIPASLWNMNERKKLGNEIVFGGKLMSFTNFHCKLHSERTLIFIIIHHKFSLPSASLVLVASKSSRGSRISFTPKVKDIALALDRRQA